MHEESEGVLFFCRRKAASMLRFVPFVSDSLAAILFLNLL
jgi:hypothetical protein